MFRVKEFGNRDVGASSVDEKYNPQRHRVECKAIELILSKKTTSKQNTLHRCVSVFSCNILFEFKWLIGTTGKVEIPIIPALTDTFF